MTSATFELGHLRIKSKYTQMALDMSASFSLTMPYGLPEPLTLNSLAQHVLSGELWVAKAGKLRLEISSSIQGEPAFLSAQPGATMEVLMDIVQQCPVRFVELIGNKMGA